MKKLIYPISFIIFILFAAYIYKTSVWRISQNFDVVEPNRVYRSAQLDEKELVEIIDKYQIKTVISLRGSPQKTMFYEAEEPIIFKKGVHYEYMMLSDDHFPEPLLIQHILDIFSTKQYPMLIHCRVGADRTGMIAGIYQKIINKKSLEESLEQLTFRNWHVQFLHPAMSAFVREAKDYDWLMKDYDLCNPAYAAYRKPEYVCP
ncbi:MAG: tyrosine-protein phosphatase [Bdellovibrionaceae bacterium]|nr:tyrosine-protein phosphatase [Bdellovibrio sp.]